MQFTKLNLSQKIVALTVSVALAMLIVIALSSYIGSTRSHNLVNTDRVSTYNKVFWEQVNKDAESLEKLLSVLTKDTQLLEPFVAQDRDKILEAVKPTFDNLKQTYRITHFYFIDKNGTVLLRAHNPGQFGDNLKRATFTKARDTGAVGKGIEMGKQFFSLRVVMPVRQDGEIIGYFELGEELDHLIKGFHEITGAEISMWINRGYAERLNLTKVFNPVGDWFLVMASNTDLQKALMADLSGSLTKGVAQSINTTVSGVNYDISTFGFNDAFGVEAGVVTIATDATNTNALFRNHLVAVLFISVLLCAMFIAIAIYVAGAIAKPLRLVSKSLHEIAQGEGDLTLRLPVHGRDEVSLLADNFNQLMSKLQDLIRSIKATGKELATSSHELSAVAENTSHSVTLQQDETQQVATAINEMAATVQEIARNATLAAESADQADKQVTEGKNAVSTTMEAIGSLANNVEQSAAAIEKLREGSDKIGTVLDVIKTIAEQTNLLALNAAIEAARAGEQGRGFAVVADEVRTLAQRTQVSTHEIEQMISAIQQGTRDAVSTMTESRDHAKSTVEKAGHAGAVLDAITATVSKISEMNTQTATATEEQSSVAAELDSKVEKIKNYATEAANGASQVAGEGTKLAQIGTQLQDLLSRFKV